jgi:hypothetical protein
VQEGKVNHETAKERKRERENMAKKTKPATYYMLKIGYSTIALPDSRGLQTIMDALSRGVILDSQYIDGQMEYFRDRRERTVELEIVAADRLHLDQFTPGYDEPAPPANVVDVRAPLTVQRPLLLKAR